MSLKTLRPASFVLSPRQAWSSIREDMNRRFIQAKLVSSSLLYTAVVLLVVLLQLCNASAMHLHYLYINMWS